MLTSRGLGVVLGDLAQMGFDARWGVLGAADVGAPHQRDRIWIVGKTTDTASIGLHNEKNKCVMESKRGSEFQFGEPRDSGEMADTTELLRDGGNHNTGISVGRQSISEPRNSSGQENVAYSREIGLSGKATNGKLGGNRSTITSMGGKWWEREPKSTTRTTQPELGGVAHGVAARVDRLKAIGNGQVPEVARTAWKLLR